MHENNYKSSWVVGNLSSSASSVREGTRSGIEEYASQLAITTATPGWGKK
jgi:hypothetical protein